MINTWFISDTHLGHSNILKYEPEARPFSTVEEMNEKIIENWNAVVKPNDIVFHLGDFAFGRNNIAMASRLNGRKKLVMGNHDTYDYSLYTPYFERLYGAFYWKRCILTHIPVHPDNLGSRFLLNVHGHLHSKNIKYPIVLVPGWIIDDPNYFNVSCEQNNLTPIHADIILERIKEIDDD
jgi:calcineurin-like phosphoesterase family protein